MPKIVVSDTSVLILLTKIGEMDLLKETYGQLVTTLEVEEEFGSKLPEWIKTQEVVDKKYQRILETRVDKGEAIAIAFATEYDEVLLLLDDLKARKLASKLNLKFTGTLGVIHRAKQQGIIEKVKPLLDKMSQTDFRISKKIITEILILNKE